MNEEIPHGGNGYLKMHLDGTCTKYLLTKHLKSSDRVRRFKREYQILNQLNQDFLNDLSLKELNGICKVIPDSLIEKEEELSFKMVTINHDAKPLDKVVDWTNPTPLDPQVAENYFRQLLQIVDNCHKVGIIHRDIKPNNILISNSVVYLIDFGLSCVINEGMGINQIDDNITNDDWSGFNNALVRLPEFEYSSDNFNEVRDHRSDITLCVAVFYYLLTGEKGYSLWGGGNTPINIDEYKHSYMVHKGLSYLMESRYQSIDDILVDLDHEVNDLDHWMNKRRTLYSENQIDIRDWKSQFCQKLYQYHPKEGRDSGVRSNGTFVTKHTNNPKTLTWSVKNVAGTVIFCNATGNNISLYEDFRPDSNVKAKWRRMGLYFHNKFSKDDK